MVAEMLAGLVSGGVYAALAVCIVLMYQMLGVVNLALGAMGALAACMSLLCVRWFGLGPGPSTLVAVLCGALIGVVLGLLMVRYFLEASVELRTTVTIAITVGIIAVGDRILNGATYSFPNLFYGPEHRDIRDRRSRRQPDRGRGRRPAGCRRAGIPAHDASRSAAARDVRAPDHSRAARHPRAHAHRDGLGLRQCHRDDSGHGGAAHEHYVVSLPWRIS